MQPQPGPPLFLSFSANNRGRDLVVGDVHGQFDMLEALLSQIEFDEADDRLFMTGDLIDRGPYSHQVLDWLDKPWLHAVRGNHEQMALDCVAGTGDPPRHTRNGGRWFHERPCSEQQQIAERLALLPVAISVQLRSGDCAGIIHAEPPGWEHSLDWPQAIALLDSAEPQQQHHALTQALYARTRITTQDCRPFSGVDKLYVGHSTVPEILHLGNVVYVDTGCSFADGKLTLIDMLSGEAFSVRPQQHMLCL
ncbi:MULTISPECIES: metallophosphoesterase [unclassified Pseudomonas]|uniref:metallophosphoesterase n=1 Tax=unclassified Pseudomonas TaxID=196821 RepID=UPI0021CAA077|nr:MULTISPECIES: metallophosphoesterase [unclassified Pseudomonas]MCU1733969.1 metallophosphoesterase [Pseudomonas sp. 20P_3.2_Bac4]MCU1742363.1 metallophosphoesterase [Pseudomonas sp. 20P_3.2_Bac5]